MKIAFVGQNQKADNPANIKCHILEIAEKMSAQGHEVTLYGNSDLFLSPGKSKSFGRIRFINLPRTGFESVDIFLGNIFSVAHIYFNKYDVIHDISDNSKILESGIKKFMPDAILVSMDELQCPLKIRKTKPARSGPQLRSISKLGLRDKRYALFVGELEKDLGIHYLVEAFKYLEDTAKTPNNFKLVIADDGSNRDEEYLDYLRLIGKGRNNIILFSGKQKTETLKNLYLHAYLFVQPSEVAVGKERLLEAMGYGIAPLVSNLEENLETIGDCGFSFESKSIKNLQDKLAYLLNRNEDVERAGLLAKEHIKSEYSCDSVVKKTIDTYRQRMVTK